MEVLERFLVSVHKTAIVYLHFLSVPKYLFLVAYGKEQNLWDLKWFWSK